MQAKIDLGGFRRAIQSKVEGKIGHKALQIAAGGAVAATIATSLASCGTPTSAIPYVPLGIDNPNVRCTNIQGNVPMPGTHVPTVQYGTEVIGHMNVELVFAGDYWTTPDGQARVAALNQFETSQNTDPINDITAEYGTQGRHFIGSVVLPNVQPGAYGEADIQKMAADVSNGVAPADVVLTPSAPGQQDVTSNDGSTWKTQKVKPAAAPSGRATTTDNTLYEIVLAPGDVLYAFGVDSTQGLGGYHGTVTDNKGTELYAADAYPSKGNSVDLNDNAIDSLTTIMTHEEAEAETDPYLGTGVVDPTRGDELGDWTVNDSGLKLKQVLECGSGNFARQLLWSPADYDYEIERQFGTHTARRS